MTTLTAAFAELAAAVRQASAEVGRPVTVDPAAVADRRDALELRPPGLWSPNRSCRLVRAADGWIAVNLPRASDLADVPAWLCATVSGDPWRAIGAIAAHTPRQALIDQARLLGLPIAAVGEVRAASPLPPLVRFAPGAAGRGGGAQVLDLSGLWAGPLCGALLAQAGFAVTKLESHRRPDVMADSAPGFFRRLNGEKRLAALDFTDPADVARLSAMIDAADVLITSARPRAFEQLGLSPAAIFARNPGLVWVAISGYGWTGEASDRVAFGDDAAAAGGLVRWTSRGEPRFIGDALADPLTGLAAAAGAFAALRAGGGLLVDAAMTRTAAGVAATMAAARAGA
ncbi:CoA transferase [Caulobacter sp. KR2-114]|uniref:CoA transferase n=1 Tax=Caulobacter sp. KR2-114 TaxID=3400912 RepID=UPI003BFCDE66